MSALQLIVEQFISLPSVNILQYLSTPTTTTIYGYDDSPHTTSADSSEDYYGYRYYSPEMGRWVSWAPIGEQRIYPEIFPVERRNI